MKEIRNLIESSEEFRIQGNAVAAHLKLLDAVRALAARVEEMEKRPIVGEGTPREFFMDMSRWIERGMTAASGGPKQEALPSPLDQWGDPPFPAEATPKPNPDLWSSCAPRPCVHCHELTNTSYNAVPMHRGCNRPASGGPKREQVAQAHRRLIKEADDFVKAQVEQPAPPDAGAQEAEPVVCPSCKNEIDPEICSCGDYIKNHSYMSGHSPVPMGCTCGYTEQPPPPAAPERQEQKRYSVEVDKNGCERCGVGKLWVVVENGIAGGTSYGNEEEAKSLCDELNFAFNLGLAAQHHPAQWREARGYKPDTSRLVLAAWRNETETRTLLWSGEMWLNSAWVESAYRPPDYWCDLPPLPKEAKS